MTWCAFDKFWSDFIAAACNSILLLVVFSSDPDISFFSLYLFIMIAAQPPGPGFPKHAPSV